MKISPTERLDAVNIGLMMVSCAIAIVIPFELFLFSYAILGPLHYLTEISWLHDKKYFSKKKYDPLILLIIGLCSTIVFFSAVRAIDFEAPQNSSVSLIYWALLAAALFAFVKSNYVRIIGFVLIFITTKLAHDQALFLGVLLPTLIHVYIFTALFMLYGALKSKSRLGVISVVVLAICPFFLWFAFPNTIPFPVSAYGKEAYIGGGVGFSSLNETILPYFGVQPTTPITSQAQYQSFWLDAVFHSKTGILLMRFIAFAYTYHYLNWFSKTRVIQWHKVPKVRFGVVLLFWAISVALYLKSYSLGLMWLFFLSYVHVLLEFPLNYTSIAGIGRYFQQKLFKPKAELAMPEVRSKQGQRSSHTAKSR